MSKNHVEIIQPELSINQKLGHVKFKEVFDNETLTEAEKAVQENARVFKEETLKDFAALKHLFITLSPQELNKESCQKLCDLAFSIKSRAATGGLPLASEIAESMYEFCDCEAATNIASEESYKLIKLHFDALEEVFKNNPANDAKSKKLAQELKKMTSKYL